MGLHNHRPRGQALTSTCAAMTHFPAYLLIGSRFVPIKCITFYCACPNIGWENLDTV